jgi:hypothetical protein
MCPWNDKLGEMTGLAAVKRGGAGEKELAQEAAREHPAAIGATTLT